MHSEWIVYGRASVPPPQTGRSITSRRYQSLEDAEVYLVKCMLEYGRVVATLIHLERGLDINGERHVVRRINEGRAWWE